MTKYLSLTEKGGRGQLSATPGRRKCLKSRVSHLLLQICIHTIHTQLTSHHNSSCLTLNINSLPHYRHTYQQTHSIPPQSHNITYWRVRDRSAVRHIRQPQVHEVQSQSLPPATLYPHHPHTTHIRQQSLSLTRNINPLQKLPTHTCTTITTQKHSPARVSEVSFVPHPADASA